VTARTERSGGLSPRQWKSGAAAWLGWLFDGLELHLYTLVATPLVVHLLGAPSSADPAVKEKSAFIQAAFLVGWALGGAFFGRLGDRIGRSRALSLTILTYALCTGLCATAQTWGQLMLFRFLAALGIGGEWAVGAALLAETWPVDWRPWLSAVLQSAVNLGILVAAGLVTLLSFLPHPPSERWVFLIGVAPALMVFWIRAQVPESDAWKRAESETAKRPGIRDLFRGEVAPITLNTSVVCALGLSGWWLFQFWHPQHLRRLLEISGAAHGNETRAISAAFFFLNVVAIAGNFAAGWLASRMGNRRAIMLIRRDVPFHGRGIRGAPGLSRDGLVLDAASGVFLRGIRALHHVPSAAFPDAPKDHGGGLLLQYRAPGGSGGLACLRARGPGRRLPGRAPVGESLGPRRHPMDDPAPG